VGGSYGSASDPASPASDAPSSPSDNPPVQLIPWWAVAAGGAAPALLIGGFLAATALQPRSYDPVRDTISRLAAIGANDPWLMTSALGGVGLCYLLAAFGLQPAGALSRGLLASGGLATLCIALFRQPPEGYSVGHELAVIVAALTCCTWPVFARHRSEGALLLARTPSYTATVALLGVAAWYALESHGALLGIAERCAAAAPALWLFAVVISARRAGGRRLL
jgi:hypothetical membrane protein